MAIITIVNKSKLNSCWSAFQYTNQCHRCNKCMPDNKSFSPCKIKSEEHKTGVIIVTEGRIRHAKRRSKHAIYQALRNKRKALKMFV